MIVIIADEQQNAKFVSPTQERVSAGTQHCFQCLGPLPVTRCSRIIASSDGVKIFLRLDVPGDI